MTGKSHTNQQLEAQIRKLFTKIDTNKNGADALDSGALSCEHRIDTAPRRALTQGYS